MEYDCNRGWYSLIEESLAEIAKVYPNYKVEEVKEKFGELRIYIANPSVLLTEDEEQKEWIQHREALKIVEAAIEKSRTICELCGKPALVRTVGRVWKMSRCSACYEKYKATNVITDQK